MRSPLVRGEMLNPLACSPSETGGVARRLPDCGRWDYIRRRAWSRNEEIDRDGPGMPVVRAPVPGSPRRFPPALLLRGAPDGILVRAAPLGRACRRCRRPDRRSHQECRSRSMHASPRRLLALACRTVEKRAVTPAESSRGGRRPARRFPDRAARPAGLVRYRDCALERCRPRAARRAFQSDRSISGSRLL